MNHVYWNEERHGHNLKIIMIYTIEADFRYELLCVYIVLHVGVNKVSM